MPSLLTHPAKYEWEERILIEAGGGEFMHEEPNDQTTTIETPKD